MPLPYPLNRYRPIRTADGEGGFTEALPAPLVIYGVIEVHKNETMAIVDLYDDVKIDDILGVTTEESSTEARYRVKASSRILDTVQRELTLERLDRPISP